MQVTVVPCLFKRAIDSPKYEYGIALGLDDTDIYNIVDLQFKAIVHAPYRCHLLPYMGLMNVWFNLIKERDK